MTTDRSDILSLLKAALSQNRLLEAAQLLDNLHPADIADFFEALDEDEKKKLFRKLDTDTVYFPVFFLAFFKKLLRNFTCCDNTLSLLGEIFCKISNLLSTFWASQTPTL